jgi:4-coumarate--CoA ligase
MLSSAQCIQISKAFPQITNPTMLCFSSLYWLSGFTILLYSLVNVSKRVITKRKFSPLVMIHLIEQYKVNVVVSAPSHVAMLVQSPALPLADLSSVRLYLVAGGFCAQNLRETLQDHLLYGALVVTYGMTETGTIIASTMPFQKPSNSVGKISVNMQMKVRCSSRKVKNVDENFRKVVDDDGNGLDPSEIGEIYLKSPNLFMGYAGKPEETREAFDVHGWLRTGDLGYFTVDGEIFIVDRKKEMIKYLNYQVAPSEIEACILKIEGVKGVCVVGIPDILAGDLAAAVVVKEGNSFLTEQDIIDEVASELNVKEFRSSFENFV